jgi:chemosensory pili system protein ChpA (sensor histidine kinase/response regulator)
MASSPANPVDLGPLSWVKTEIEHSLAQARESLDKLAAQPAERAPASYILTHLHQATGALAMVGLAAATRFSEELEKVVAFLETEEASRLGAAVAAAKRGIAALSGYLDGLLAGAPDRPMALLPAYIELNRARGAADANEGDLFFPSLGAPLPAGEAPGEALDDAVRLKALAHQRAQYQQGLLRILKGGDTSEALRQMHGAVLAIASLEAAGAQRAFWCAAAGFFDALVLGGLEAGPAAKPLFAKLDQQVKQLIEGSTKVPERLFRDLLLAVARSRRVSERVSMLHEVYALEALLAQPDRPLASVGDEALATLVRELRELTSVQKESWLKYTSGNRAALEPFGKQSLALVERAGKLPEREILAVLGRLADVAPALKARSIPPSEAQALEVATALLFVETALENYFRLGPDFARQARAMIDRLRSAMAGEALPPVDASQGGLLDEMTRRAQERLLVFQVGQEVQVNLQNIEQALDAFFRDPDKRPALKGLPALFAQVQGALMIMELADAAKVNAAVGAMVAQFAEGSLDAGSESAERVADGLSALGLYITALQQGAANPHDYLVPALTRLGIVAAPAPAAEPEALATATVSPLDIDVQKQKVQALYEEWREAPAETTRARLGEALGELKRDAEVVEDAEVSQHSLEALEALEATADPSQTGVFRALQDLAPEKPPEAPPEQVVQLVDAPGAEIDQELLGIFLEEAAEVIASISESLETARGAPHDREALATIRRGFHTLKGSGRMVGLDALGEVAWACEQVMNKWLKEEKPASEGLLRLIDRARTSFGDWVEHLRAGSEAAIDGREIQAAAERLKSGEAAAAPAALEALEPVAAQAAPPAAAPAPEPAAEPEVALGPITLSSAFYSIYLGEAEEHAQALGRELAEIEADPVVPVSADFMRAAHTLASSSRTTGIGALADLAQALEGWLQDAIDLPPVMDAARLGAMRRAVDAIAAMVSAVRAREMPGARADLVEELAGLRAGLAAARRTGEGTHVRIPEAVREALAALPEVKPESERPVEALPAPAGEAFEAGKDKRRVKDDVDADLLPIFLEEAKDIIPQVAEGVRRWRAAPSDPSPTGELQRHLHTLKGSARMAGLMRLGELAHLLEARVIAAESQRSPGGMRFDELEEMVDRFSGALERLSRGEEIHDALPLEVPVAAVIEQRKDKPGAIAVLAAAAQEALVQGVAPEARESRTALLRVNAELIDRFVNEAGELSIARSRIEGEMAAFKRALLDLAENVSRMRTQLREIEISAETQMQSRIKEHEVQGEAFDPLEFDRFSRVQELTRFLAESLGDVITLQQGLQKNLDETELAIHQQARLNRELQQGLMGVRLVPLANLADRFYRVVRQTAKELGKKANLEFKGSRVELDRSVLEKITGPFEHLLRNAVGHGLEAPAERLARGKPEIGELSIDAAQRGNEVVLTVADDGAGLDYRRIREKAVEAGLLAADVELPEAQLAQYIFTPGFSTAKEVTAIAGRGVGMDVVKNEITSLGGRVEIASTPGRGTTFTITLPLTLAVTQAVMLRAGTTTYAVPSVMIEQVQEYKLGPYEELVRQGEVRWKDNRYPLRSLLPLIGEIDTPTPARQIPVLLLKSGVQRAAIRVDEIIGNREIVVKTIGPQLSRLAGVAGATVLGSGQVVLILNPVQLVHRAEALAAPEGVRPAAEPGSLVVDGRSGAPRVMVVDDSLTVRKITGRMLAREGYEVATAKDGVDALQQLQDVKPDCILLDVEMPRMDGFEFARNVRADAATKSIPIIMITSRTADKHRSRALEIGVNEYMGKPYQEDELLALIKRYTEAAAFA